MKTTSSRLARLLAVFVVWALAPSFASGAPLVCKRSDPKMSHLRQSSYTIFEQFDTPWVTFHSAATPNDCHSCLRAYDAQLGLLSTTVPLIASPRARNHEARAAVLQLVETANETLTQCHITATEKPLKRLSLCKDWRGITTKYLEQILFSQLTAQPFTAHQLFFARITSLVRECALDR